jgi:hypothetical protein
MEECCLLIIVLLLWFLYMSSTEGMMTKPKEEEKKMMAHQIYGAKEIFDNNQTLDNAKNKLPWLDNVTYEDARNLHRKDQFNVSNLMNILQ